MSQRDEQYRTLDENVDIIKLHDILSPLRAKWQMFGAYLKVPVAELERIRTEPGVEDRLFELLVWWLRNNRRPTWPAVVDALLSANRRNIAREVNREYCPDYQSPLDRRSQPQPEVSLCMTFCDHAHASARCKTKTLWAFCRLSSQWKKKQHIYTFWCLTSRKATATTLL